MQARAHAVQSTGAVRIDHDLLERYGRIPVPRYTSYPPANHWEATFGESEAREAFRSAGTRAASVVAGVAQCFS